MEDLRSELETRPLLTLSLALICGLTAVDHPLNLLLAALLLPFTQSLRSRLVVALGLLVGLLIHPTLPKQGITEQRFVEGNVQVQTVPRIKTYGQIVETEIEGLRLYLVLPLAAEIDLGDTLHIAGVARPLSEAAEQAALPHGVVGTVKVHEGFFRKVREGPPVVRWAGEWRRRFLKMTEDTMDPRAAAVVDALCFNVDGLLDDETRDQMQKTGTVHIVSASGLHVLLISLFVSFLLSRLPIPRPVQLALLAAFLAFYALAAGLQVAVVRATLMALIAATAYLWRREADLLSALGLTATVVLLYNQTYVYQLGFQFSFLVVGALALFSGESRPEVTGGKKWVEEGKSSLQGSFVATLAAAPLAARSFGLVSIVAILANLLIGVAIGPIIVISLVALAFRGPAPGLAAGLMKNLVEPLAGWIIFVLEKLGNHPAAAVTVPQINGYIALAFYVLFLIVWRKRVRPA